MGIIYIKYYTFRFHHTLCSKKLSIEFTLCFCTADRHIDFVTKASFCVWLKKNLPYFTHSGVRQPCTDFEK